MNITKRNGSWRIRVYDYTDDKGRKHYKSFTNKNKAECIRKANEWDEMNKAHKLLKMVEHENELTLKDAYQRYIDIKKPVLSPNTIREYKRSKNRDFPELMNYKIKYINSNMVQLAINKLCNVNSPKTIKNKYSLLKSVMKQFEPNKIIKITLPQAESKETYVPTLQEYQKILDNSPDYLKVPIILGGKCGLRRGEICALTSEDILDDGININKAMAKDEDGKWIIKPPKSQAGYRFVPADEETIQIVRKWHFKMRPGVITDKFNLLMKRLNMEDVHFHSLRHMFVTELYDKGINAKTIAKYSGHSVDMVLHIYAHARRSKKTDKTVISVFKNIK